MLAMLLTRLNAWEQTLQTGGLPEKAFQYYNGKVYTLQEAAKLRELDSISREVIDDSIVDNDQQVVYDVQQDVSYDLLLHDIRSRQQKLKEIQQLRRELEVDSSLKILEAQALRKEEEVLKLEIKSMKEERELLLALIILL